MGARGRRVLRVAAVILLGLLSLVLIAAALLVVLLETEWGRERARVALEAELDERLEGEVTVGRLDGSITGALTLRDLEIHDERGRVAVAADRIDVDFAPLALMRRQIRAERVRIEGLRVHAYRGADGRLNLAALAAEPDEPGAPGWPVEIETLEVEGGIVTYADPSGERLRLTGLDARGALAIDDGRVAVDVASATVRWPDTDVDLTAEGAIFAADGALTVSDAAVRLGDSIVRVPHLLLTSGGDTGQGRFALELAAVDARRVLPAWRADLRAEGELSRARPEAAWQLGRRAAAAGAALDADASIDPGAPGVELRARATDLDPAALIEGGPEGALDVRLTGSASGATLETLEATLDADVAGQLEGQAIRGGRVEGGVDRGEVRATLSADTDLGRVETTLRGRLVDVDVSTTLRDEDRWLALELRVTDRGRRATGRFEAGDDAAALAASGQVDLIRDEDRIRARLIDVRVRTGSLVWRADAARVTVGPDRALAIDTAGTVVDLDWPWQVAPLVADFELRLRRRDLVAALRVDGGGAGAAAVELAIRAPADPLDADAWGRLARRDLRELRARADGVDLERLRPLVPALPALAGRLHAEVTAGPDPAAPIVGTAVVEALRLRGELPPLDTWARAEMTGDRTHLEAQTRHGDRPLIAGRAELGAGIDAALAGDVAGFLAAPARGYARVYEVPLDELAATLAPEPAPAVSGAVSAELYLAGTVAAPALDLEASAPRTTLDTVELERLLVRGRVRDGAWQALLAADQVDGGALQVSASSPSFDRRDVRVWLGAKDVSLAFVNPILARRPGALREIGGMLDAQVMLAGVPPAGGAETLDGWLRVRRGRADLERNVEPIRDATVEVTARDGALRLSARGRSGGGRFSARGEAALEHLTPRRFELALATRSVPVVIPQLTAELDVDAAIRGELDGDLWRVDATVERGLVRLPEQARRGQLHDTGPLEDVVFVDAAGVAARERAVRERPRPPLSARARIRTPDPVRIRGEEIDAFVLADLEVTYLAGRLFIEGLAETTTGTVTLLDRRYDIVRARAVFEGRAPIDPRLNIRLSRVFDPATVYVDVSGTSRELQVDFSSDPPVYDRAELLGFVITGAPADAGRAARPLEERGLGVVSGLVGGQLAGILGRAFPIDTLRLGTEELLAEQRITYVLVGTWVTDDLFVAFRRVFDPVPEGNLNEARLEYRLTREWILDAAFGDRGVGSADILWTRRF